MKINLLLKLHLIFHQYLLLAGSIGFNPESHFLVQLTELEWDLQKSRKIRYVSQKGSNQKIILKQQCDFLHRISVVKTKFSVIIVSPCFYIVNFRQIFKFFHSEFHLPVTFNPVFGDKVCRNSILLCRLNGYSSSQFLFF